MQRMLWDIKLSSYQGLNLPEPHVDPSRKTPCQISNRRFRQPVSGLDSLVSRYVLLQHAGCSLLLGNMSTRYACAQARGEERTDLAFSTNSPHHGIVCLPSEEQHIFYPGGRIMRDYHFMGAGGTTEGPHIAYREPEEV